MRSCFILNSCEHAISRTVAAKIPRLIITFMCICIRMFKQAPINFILSKELESFLVSNLCFKNKSL